MMTPLPEIPLVDLRKGGPVLHARLRTQQARALRDACLSVFPRPALPLVPALDRASRRWLQRANSPYFAEIAEIADALAFSGVWLLNASYQWGCTSLAADQDSQPWLARTLDWPFPGLGRHAEIALMDSSHGAFYSVTWPGYAGALTVMAPSRFAVCINQAPMRRRTTHRYLRPYDFLRNTGAAWRRRGLMPPDQLLRLVCEQCADFPEARGLLESTPIARPAIFILVGCCSGQNCIIERTETDFVSRERDTSAANDWVPLRPGWEGRIGTRRFLTSSMTDAADYSHARRDALQNWDGPLSAPGFDWVREPVLNPYTRLAVAMCPARGLLRAVGYDRMAAVLPEPVTQIREIELPPRSQAAAIPAMQ